MKKNIALSIVLMFSVSACSSQKSSDRYREGDNAGQKVDLTVDQEKQLTKEALAEMKKDYPAVKNRELDVVGVALLVGLLHLIDGHGGTSLV